MDRVTVTIRRKLLAVSLCSMLLAVVFISLTACTSAVSRNEVTQQSAGLLLARSESYKLELPVGTFRDLVETPTPPVIEELRFELLPPAPATGVVVVYEIGDRSRLDAIQDTVKRFAESRDATLNLNQTILSEASFDMPDSFESTLLDGTNRVTDGFVKSFPVSPGVEATLILDYGPDTTTPFFSTTIESFQTR